jgi:hypothetical protein
MTMERVMEEMIGNGCLATEPSLLFRLMNHTPAALSVACRFTDCARA